MREEKILIRDLIPTQAGLGHNYDLLKGQDITELGASYVIESDKGYLVVGSNDLTKVLSERVNGDSLIVRVLENDSEVAGVSGVLDGIDNLKTALKYCENIAVPACEAKDIYSITDLGLASSIGKWENSAGLGGGWSDCRKTGPC